MDKIHLQASVAAIRGDYDYQNEKYWLETFISNIGTNNHNQAYLIIRVYPESYFKEEKEEKYINMKNISTTPNILVIEITIERLIGHLIFDKTSKKSIREELIHIIFGPFQDKLKNVESLSSNCLF